MLGFIVSLVMAGQPLPFSELVATSTPQEIYISKIADCESGGDTTIKVLDTNNKYSYGYLQFQMGTWLKYQNLGTTRANIYDKDLQIKVAKYMLDNPKETGGRYNWLNCTRPLGSYPNTPSL